MRYEQWSTACPKCGTKDEIYVVEVTMVTTGDRVRMHSLLEPDGFMIPVDYNVYRDASTEKEIVECQACGERMLLAELYLPL